MATDATVGILRVVLASNTAQFDAGMDKAGQKISGLKRVSSTAARGVARLVGEFNGTKVMTEATKMAAAVEKVGGASKLTETELNKVNRTLDASIAKFKALGQEVPPQVAKLKDEITALGQAGGQAAAPQGGLGAFNGVLGMAAKLLPGLSVGAAVAGFVGLGKAALESSDRLVTFSTRAGVSIETAQQWEYVAGQTSTSLEAFAASATKLGVNIGNGTEKVRKAVDGLGLSYRDLRDMKPEEQFDTVVQKLEGVESATERNRLGQALFGKQFSEIAVAVAEGYTKMKDEASVASDAQVRAAEAAGDAWEKAKNKIAAAALQGLGRGAQEFFDTPIDLGLLDPQQMQQYTMLLKTQGDAYGYLLDLERERTKGMRDVNLATEQGVEAGEDYVAALAAVRKEVDGLTKQQRVQLTAALELEGASEELADQFGVSVEALRMFQAQQRGATASLKELTAEKHKAAEAAERFNASVSRSLAVLLPYQAAVVDTATEVRALGGDMSDLASGSLLEYGEASTRARREAEQWAIANGAVLAPSIEAVGTATDDAGESALRFTGTMRTVKDAVNGTFAQMLLGAKGFGDGMQDIWNSIKAGAARVFGEILADFGGRFLRGMVGMMRGQQGSWGQAFAGMFSGGGAAGMGGGGGMSSVAQAGFGLGSGAGSGGAGAAGAGGAGAGAAVAGGASAAMAGWAMGKWGQEIFGGAGWKAGGFGAAGGAAAGAAIGSVLPGIGTAVGAIVGGLAGMAAGFIGTSKQVKETSAGVEQFQQKIRDTLTDQQRAEAGGEVWKETVIGVRDAYLATGRTAEEAEDAVSRMWDTGNPERALAAVEEINAAMQEYALHMQNVGEATSIFDAIMEAGSQGIPASFQPAIDKLIEMGLLTDAQVEKLRGLNEAAVDVDQLKRDIELFGGRLDSLGPRFAQANLDKTAGQYINAIDRMVKAGGDVGGILFDAKEELSKLAVEAIKTGRTLPANMKPWIEDLAKSGNLVDENGNKLTDLSGIKWGDAIETEGEKTQKMWDKIAASIERLVTHIAGPLEDAIDHVTRDRDVDIDVNYRERGTRGGNESQPEGDRTGFSRGTLGRLGSYFARFSASGSMHALHGTQAVLNVRDALPFAINALAGRIPEVPALPQLSDAGAGGGPTSTMVFVSLPAGQDMDPAALTDAVAKRLPRTLAFQTGELRAGIEFIVGDWHRSYGRG